MLPNGRFLRREWHNERAGRSLVFSFGTPAKSRLVNTCEHFRTPRLPIEGLEVLEELLGTRGRLTPQRLRYALARATEPRSISLPGMRTATTWLFAGSSGTACSKAVRPRSLMSKRTVVSWQLGT